MGEKALDRDESIKERYPPTAAAVLADSSRRTGTDVATAFVSLVLLHVSPLKYRSARRGDQLLAVMRLLVVAALMFGGGTVDCLRRWNTFLLPTFHVAAWDFPTVYPGTPIQQIRAP